MRASYLTSGIVLTVLGLVVLMATGGFTFWASGTTSSGQYGSSSATIGIPGVLGWAMFLVGVALIVVGAVADPYNTTQARRGTGKDITVVK